jgi:heme exporter protein B
LLRAKCGWLGGAAVSGCQLFSICRFRHYFPLWSARIGPCSQKPAAGWIAALLASLLPIERLILPDRDAGVLDQLTVRGWTDEWIAAAKLVGHFAGFGMPLLLATPVAVVLMGVPDGKTWPLIAGLALALPGLAGLGVTIAALTAGLRGASALGGLLLVPLAIPILIFGAGTLGDNPGNALQLLGATSLAMTALSPFAAGAALRAGRS